MLADTFHEKQMCAACILQVKISKEKMLSLQVFFCYCFSSEVMRVNPFKQCPGSSLTF